MFSFYYLDAPEPDTKAGIQYTVQTRPGFDCNLLMKNLGNPHPTYKWTHNGAMVSHKDFSGVLSIAKITDVKIKDFGNYTLMMNNVEGTYVAHYVIEPYGNLFLLFMFVLL